MYEVLVLDLIRNITFTKTFSSPFLARKFINKCKYSRKVRVIGTTGLI